MFKPRCHLDGVLAPTVDMCEPARLTWACVTLLGARREGDLTFWLQFAIEMTTFVTRPLIM